MFSWTFVMVVHRFDYIIYNPLHKTYRHRHRHSHAWGIYDMVDRFLLKRFHLSAYSVHPFPMIPLNICHRFAVHCVCHIANKCVLGPSATHTHTQTTAQQPEPQTRWQDYHHHWYTNTYRFRKKKRKALKKPSNKHLDDAHRRRRRSHSKLQAECCMWIQCSILALTLIMKMIYL